MTVALPRPGEIRREARKHQRKAFRGGCGAAVERAKPVAPAEVEEMDEEEFGRYTGSSNSGTWRVHV